METTNKKIIKIVGILFAIGILCCVALTAYVFINLMPVKSSDDTLISFEVKEGMGVNAIIDKLEEEGLIKNATVLKLYIKLEGSKDFYAGTYKLSKSMDANTIIECLSSGDSIEHETISVTFVEGKRFPYYAAKIADNFGYKEEDVYKVINEEFLKSLIEKYWFVDESILNEELYYPLEGYVFPDTYEFKKDSTIEEVLDKMIQQLGTKLNDYKDEIELSNYSIHSLLTLASVVELEAVTPEDRGNVAGVLYNRLKTGMTLGCDVTTYYGAKVEVGNNHINFNACNAYNTRGECVKGIPVGPIASPSLTSIVSAITPTTNEYYYFVADAQNKVYFAKNNTEQQNNIATIKKAGLWIS